MNHQALSNCGTGSGGGTTPADISLPNSDCLLVSDNGREFPSCKWFLSLKSPVFKELIEGCSRPGEELRVPVTNASDEAVELFWRQLHGYNPPLSVAACTRALSMSDITIATMGKEISLLIEVAHKHDCPGMNSSQLPDCY